MGIVYNHYTDEYRADYDRRIQEKISRTWTRSLYVEEIFAYMDSTYPSALYLSERNKLSSYSHKDFAKTGIGYANPKDGVFAKKLYSSPSLVARGWDARFTTACGNEMATVGNNLIDVPTCMTDYADTIIVTENPAHIDLLIHVGEFAFPAHEEDEVFLALHPDFVDSTPEIDEIVFRAATEGKVLDTRPYIASGKLETRTTHLDKYNCLCKMETIWHGYTPFDAAIPDIRRKLEEVSGKLKGNILWDADTWGLLPWEDDWHNIEYEGGELAASDLNRGAFLVDAIMMQRDWLSIPLDDITLTDDAPIAGKMMNKKDWSELCKAHNIRIESDEMDPRAKEVLDKLDEADKVARIWKSMYEKYRVALHFSEKEYTKRHEYIFSRICELGRMFGVDSQIEAMRAGVPVEDIIA